jgi:uncharacterized phiE125 gp8 family phage protein
MSVQDNSLITLDFFKTMMGITSSSNDTVYENLINAAADWLDEYLGRSLIYSSYSNEVYNGSGNNILNLKNWPIVSVTSIQYRSGFGSDAVWTSLQGNEYQIDYNEGQIVVPGKFYRREINYRVTYTAGYSDDPTDQATGASAIPSSIKLALAELVQNMFTNRKINKNVKSEKLKNYAVTYAGKLVTDDLLEVFGLYRNLHA